MSSMRSEIKRLASQFEDEDDAAHDLWSWLPSYKAAQKYHGDYACEHRPAIADLMREATGLLAEAAGYPRSDARRAQDSECPCGEGHEEEPSNV